MIRCFVTDDEEYAVNTLKTYIDQTPFLEFAGSANNGFIALDFLRQHPVDLLFLDIHMPEVSGLDVLKAVSIPVILTTAYSEYAIEGFEHDVIDYLLKPIGYSRFLKAVQKAAQQREKVLAGIAGLEKNYFFVKGEYKGKQIKIEYSQLVYVEGSKNYVIFHCDNQKYMVKMTLKEAEEMLPKQHFVRIHNSYVISIGKIISIDGNLVSLKQVSKEAAKVPVSPSFKAEFMQRIIH